MNSNENICMNCGNEITGQTGYCPYCQAPQAMRVQSVSTRMRGLRTLNLKDGLPSRDEALKRMELGLERARREGFSLVRIVHGYGSSGIGGSIREVVRLRCARMIREGKLRNVIHGDDYGTPSSPSHGLIKRYPYLKKTVRTDSRNPGITFVEL